MTTHEFPLGESFRSAALSVRDLWNMPEVVAVYLSGRDRTARRDAYDAANAECFRLAHALLDAAREGQDTTAIDKARLSACAARAACVPAVFGEPLSYALEYVAHHEQECLDSVREARA